MGFIKQILLRMFGKKVDALLEKHHVSKTKAAMVLALLLPFVERMSEALGHPVAIPQEVKDGLMAFGLWALKDGQPPASPATPA